MLGLSRSGQATELDRFAAEPLTADLQLLPRAQHHILADDTTQMVQRLTKRPARLVVPQLRPEEGEQRVPPHRPPHRHHGEVGEEGEPLGLGGNGRRVVAGSVADKADAAESLELDHVGRVRVKCCSSNGTARGLGAQHAGRYLR